MSTLTQLVVFLPLRLLFLKARFKLGAPRAHFLALRRIYHFHTRITLMFPSHMSRLTHGVLSLCVPLFPRPPSLLSFPLPSLLSDGVELTGAESFTMSGSKDKLLNTHAQVTYVFARLPHSFSSPTCAISPRAPLVFLFFFPPPSFPPSSALRSYFPSFRPSEQNEFLLTAKLLFGSAAIELASVKCTKLHSGKQGRAALPGAYTLNGVVDCFNPACLHCVKDNKPLSYSEITLGPGKGSVVRLYCGAAKALSNIDALSSYSH